MLLQVRPVGEVCPTCYTCKIATVCLYEVGFELLRRGKLELAFMTEIPEAASRPMLSVLLAREGAREAVSACVDRKRHTKWMVELRKESEANSKVVTYITDECELGVEYACRIRQVAVSAMPDDP